MATKEQTKMMINDLNEQIQNLDKLIEKYKDIEFGISIVCDLRFAKTNLELSLEQQYNDLTQFECEEDEEI